MEDVNLDELPEIKDSGEEVDLESLPEVDLESLPEVKDEKPEEPNEPKKVERSKAELMALKHTAETGESGKFSAAKYFLNNILPFNEVGDEQKERLTRMKDFSEGKPHLQGRVVGNRTISPEDAMLAESMFSIPGQKPDETVVDAMWADEAQHLGVPYKDAKRADGESREEYRKRIQGIVGGNFETHVRNMDEAKRKLAETHETITDKIVVGGLPTVKYEAEMAAGGMMMKGAQGARLGFNVLSRAGLKKLLTVEGAKEFTKVAGKNLAVDTAKAAPSTIHNTRMGEHELKRDEYGVLEDGSIGVTAEGDQGDVTGKAFKNAFTENLLENAVGRVTRPLTGKIFGVIGKRGGKVGRFVNRAYQNYDRACEVTGFGDMLFEELPEENVQYFFSDVLGWGKKDSEFKGVWDELKSAFTDEEGQYTFAGQANTLLGMVMQMGLQSAYAGGKTAIEHIDAKRDIGNELEAKCGLTKEQVSKMSLQQRVVYANAWNTLASKPDELKKVLKASGEFIGSFADELVKQSTIKYEDGIRGYGVEPWRFQIPTIMGSDGKAKPAFVEVEDTDPITGETSTVKKMTDKTAGVSIIDRGTNGNGENVYELIDEKSGHSLTFDNLDQTLHYANLVSFKHQKEALDNKRKREYANVLTNTKYKRSNLIADSVADVVNAIKSGIEKSEDGTFLGMKSVEDAVETNEYGKPQLRGGARSGGFCAPDGTIVVVLDNVRGPDDMNELLAHESGHASGKGSEEAVAARAEMMKRVSPNSELGQLISQYRAKNEELGNKYEDDYIVGEAFSNWLQERGHNPSVMQRISHKMFGNIGKLNDADLEVIANQIETESANAEGTVTFLDGGYGVNETGEEEVVPEETVEPVAEDTQEEVSVDDLPEINDEEVAGGDIRKQYLDAVGENVFDDNRKISERATEDELNNIVALRKKAYDSADDADYKAAYAAEDAVLKRLADEDGAAEEAARPRKQAEVADVVNNAATPFSDEEKTALESAGDMTGIDAQGEVPAQGDYLSFLSSEAPIVRLNPAKVDRSDAVLPNMKKDANRKSGIAKPLEGEWHPTMGGIGAAWLSKKGELSVITGRHRSELAERKGKSMLYYLYREAEGFTKEQAQIYDAVANIHDEKGTINDYLQFLDHISPTREQAEKAGILYGKGLTAWSIHADASEAVRRATALDGNAGDGQITPAQATVIAQAAPKGANKRNAGIQAVLLRTALAGKIKGKAFDIYAKARAEELGKAKINENLLAGEQMDLFTSPEDLAQDILVQRQSQYRTKKANGYEQVATNLRAALNREGKLALTDEYAKELGVTDKGDKAQLEKAYDLATERADYWANRVLDEADTSAMNAEINAKADATAERLAQLKAKREAAKAGKPLPKKTPAPKAETPAKTEGGAKFTTTKNGIVIQTGMTEGELDVLREQVESKSTEYLEKSLNDNSQLSEFKELAKVELEKRKATAEEKSAVAEKPSKKRTVTMKSEEDAKAAKEALDGIEFKTDDFDPDKFGKLVTGVGKLVNILNRNGYNDFKSLATYIYEQDPDKFERARPALRAVWNTIAEQRDLEEVSKSDVQSIYDTILKESQNGKLEEPGRNDGDGDRALDRVQSAAVAKPSTEAPVRGHGPANGEEDAGTGVHGETGVEGRGVGSGEKPNPNAGGTDTPAGKQGGGTAPSVGAGEGGLSGERARGGTREAAAEGSADNESGSADALRPAEGEPSVGVEPGPRVKKAAAKASAKTKVVPTRPDFVMTKAVEDAILEKDIRKRLRNNLAAIKLIRELKDRDFNATPDEQAVLAKYVGWGGLSDIFDYNYEYAWDEERGEEPNQNRIERRIRDAKLGKSGYEVHREMRQVLNDEEYESAKASTTTAFYTPIPMVRIEHEALRALGVKGGRFLGPSAGVGNYASAAGEYEKGANWQFVEKDQLSGMILKSLFPNQRVNVMGFEETKFPDGFFDFAVDNVPYADFSISDKKLSSHNMKIHDYFFAKTLSKLRPGGVMMFLTSTGTLDKTNPILRQYLTEHGGQFVGAVRLPNGFFSDNAGTEVAADLVIVQKKDGAVDNSAFSEGVEYGKTKEWVRRKGNVEKPLTYNKYFADHPEQIVGTMDVGSGQFGPVLKYTMPEGDMFAQVRDAVGRALAGVDKDAMLKTATVAEKKQSAPVYDDEGLRQGNVTIKDGKCFIKSGDMLEPLALQSDRQLSKELAKRMKNPQTIVKGVISLRKAMRAVIDAEMNGCSDDALKPLLSDLNAEYDLFKAKNGMLHDKWVTPFVMLDKADGNRLMALEVKDRSTGGMKKADIFTKRVISIGALATKADTPKDALVISYSECGAINPKRIGQLLGVSEDEAIEKLKESGDAFDNPETGRIEPSWEYLSGKVRAKLAAARAALDAGDESFRKNVEELEKVQPPMVKLEDADIKFGATWTDVESMKDYLRDAFGSEGMSIELKKNEVTGSWQVEIGRALNSQPWGETSWGSQEFISRVLNHGSMNHYVSDPLDPKKKYLDEKQTEANKLAKEKLHQGYGDFIRQSDTWAQVSYDRYNAVMTDYVPIKLPNNILPFKAAGMSDDTLRKIFEGGDTNVPKKGREYQSAVISRGVLGGGSMCLAHCVGAGKTLEMQSIGMLGRHLGMFKKSMYVVPNHMLNQFCNEFTEAFPNANILKMTEEDVKPENRRAFFAQCANGDWDAIVVKHSTFSKKLGMSHEYQKRYMEAEQERLAMAIDAMREEGDRISVKNAEKMMERLETKLKDLTNEEGHDSQIVAFEELGVDQLFVDEAHNFKGLPITTRQGRIGGLAQGDSQRAVDMEMKTQYVQSLHGGKRGVVFATGTPLSNAPVVEAYVFLRYLAPLKLREQGLNHFDDFVDAFGQITTESEFSLDGKTVKEKEKVSAFVNIPEMMKLYKSVVDIVNSDQLDIPRPTPKYEMIDVDMTPAQEAIMEMVAKEAAKPPSREERNKYLTLTRVAKNACLTPRLLGYQDGGNKIIRAASEIKKVYDETAEQKGAQLVFTDIFNRAGEGTDAYMNGHLDEELARQGGEYSLNEEIKGLLVTAGIHAEEIEIIQDLDKAKGDKDQNKEALFAKVRAGQVRVLIGSRPKMGEGTNVQERLAAIHLLHPGWKPAEDDQAIGRIIRFGNTFKTGRIFYYLTKGNAKIGSYETKNHQLIGTKSKLIQQVMHGDETIRTIEMDESAMDRDMLMGLASGNKALMELIDVRKRVHKLELNTDSTARSARNIRDRALATQRTLEKERTNWEESQEGVAAWNKANPDGTFALTTTDGRVLDKPKDMADYIGSAVAKQLVKSQYERDRVSEIGNFNGIPLILAYDMYGDQSYKIAVKELGVERQIRFSGFMPDFNVQSLTAFKGSVLEMVNPEYAERVKRQFADLERQAKKMEADAEKLNSDYKKMNEDLAALRKRQVELEREVTPLVVQATEKKNAAAYGNWLIAKKDGKYIAQRIPDEKRVEGKTVRELLPKMDAEDFAAPGVSATKTVDLAQRLPKNSKGEPQVVREFTATEVDFQTDDFKNPAEKPTYHVVVFGNSYPERMDVPAKSMAQARVYALYRSVMPAGESRKPTYAERARMALLTVNIEGATVGGVRISVKSATIEDKAKADKFDEFLYSKLRRVASSGRPDPNGNGSGRDRNADARDVRPRGLAAADGGELAGGERGTRSGQDIRQDGGSDKPGLKQATFADLGINFKTDDLTPEETEYVEAEDKTPTEEISRNVFGMTNEEIETELRAARMEPPPHTPKPDEKLYEQAEVMLSRPEYMEKLSRAVYKFGRPVSDYENIALNHLYRERQQKVNDFQEVYDEICKTPDEVAIADPEFDRIRKEAKADLDKARALMYETGVAAALGASKTGASLRSNRLTMNKHDLSFAGIVSQIQGELGNGNIPPEMEERIRSLADDFRKLEDEESRTIYSSRIKAFSEKVVKDIKSGGKMRRLTERRPGNEGKRVLRNYADALAQIEVHAAECGGSLIGLADQMYPSWGKWLKALGEYHCYENPEIDEEACIKAITEDVRGFIEGVDEDQIRDMLTGFGHNFRQSRYDSQRMMNDLRSQARMKRQLDFMNEHNALPPVTGMVRDEPSQEARKLAHEVQERKKEVDETTGGLNRLKGALQSAKTRLDHQIEDLNWEIENGERIPRKERKTIEDAELIAKRKQRDELRALRDKLIPKEKDGMSDADRLRLVERGLMRTLDRLFEDLANAHAGDLRAFTREKKEGPNSKRADLIRNKIRAARAELAEIKKAVFQYGMTPKEQSVYLARKMKAREDAIIRVAERIERGDLRPMKRPLPQLPADLQKRYEEMGKQLKKAHQKLADMRLEAQNATTPTFIRKAGEYAKFVTASQRALRATLDFSAVLRQAARLTLGHPKMAVEGFCKAWKAMKNEGNLSQVNDEIMSDPSVQEAVSKYGLHLRDVDAESARDVEMFHGMERNRIKLFGKEYAVTDIPFFGELMLKSERHYITYLNAVSAELYSAIVNEKARFPNGATPWQKKTVCDMINMWNGAGALSKERRHAMQKAWVNEVFWAPGLAISRIQTAAGYDMWMPLVTKGVKNERGGYDEVSAEERKAMAKLGVSEHVKATLAMMALGALLRWMFSDEEDWYKFSQANWFEKFIMLLTPTIGKTSIDLSGGEASVYRLVNQIATKTKKSGSGRTQKFGTFGGTDTAGTIQRFMQGKWSPWLSEAVALWEGRDYVGDEFGIKQAISNGVIPLTFDDIYDQLSENGVGKSLVTIPLTILGAGGSTYDRKPYENAVNPFLEAKKEYDAIEKNDELTEDERMARLSKIVSDNPLMADEVREDIATEIANIRRDERKAKKAEEPDTEELERIEQAKRDLLDKIRAARR